MRHDPKQRGFTLIEIMVVVVIIGLLAGFVGPTVWQMFAKGQEDIAGDMCKQIHDKVNLFKTLSTSRKVPSDLSALAEPIVRGSDEPFYKVQNDPWGNKYWIERIDNNKFRIWSNGSDGAEGSGDDICYPPMDDR